MNKKIISVISLIVVFILAAVFLTLKTEDKRPKQERSAPHIILLTLDTTRADHLGAYGHNSARTPILDELAQNGVCFTHCIAPAVLTLPSHCSIFTGKYPVSNGIHINGSGALSSRAVTLPEILKEKDYQTAAFVAAFVLDARWGLKQGFDHYDDNIKMQGHRQFDIGKVQRPANEVVDSAIAWLGDRDTAKPLFLWLHLYDPHTPYEAPPEIRSLFPDTVSGSYDGEIAFMDHEIGRLMTFLRNQGLWENCLIIAVGDHGESLGEHGERTHGYFTYQPSIHIPLIMRFPGNQFSGERIDTPVSNVDLVPTIRDMLDCIPDPSLQGVSLLPYILGEGDRKRLVFSESLMPSIQFGWAEINTILQQKEKLIDTPEAEYFQLDNDPLEERNLYPNKTIQAKRLRNLLNESLNLFRQNRLTSETANLDQETLARLASLGYASLRAGPSHNSRDGRLRPDPKAKLMVYQQIELAASYIAEEKFSQAVQILDDLLQKEAEIPQLRLLLASTYLSQNDDQSAKKQLDIILKDNPNHIQALIAMANILKTEGNDDRMIALCKKAISLDENNTQAFSLIGESYMNKNQYADALPHLQKAVDIQPKLTQNRINLAACKIGLQQFEEASRMLHQIESEEPAFSSLHYHLALIFHRQRLLDDAEKEYLKEIAHHPASVPSRFNLAEIYFARNDLAAYRSEMETIIKISPNLARGYLFLARSFLSGDHDAFQRGVDLAKTGLKKARETKIKLLGYYLLADFYTRQSEQSKALQILEKAQTLKQKKE